MPGEGSHASMVAWVGIWALTGEHPAYKVSDAQLVQQGVGPPPPPAPGPLMPPQPRTAPVLLFFPRGKSLLP